MTDPNVAPSVPQSPRRAAESTEQSGAAVNYVHVGRWMKCAHCGTLNGGLHSEHYCGAEWQTPAPDMPDEWVTALSAGARGAFGEAEAGGSKGSDQHSREAHEREAPAVPPICPQCKLRPRSLYVFEGGDWKWARWCEQCETGVDSAKQLPTPDEVDEWVRQIGGDPWVQP